MKSNEILENDNLCCFPFVQKINLFDGVANIKGDNL